MIRITIEEPTFKRLSQVSGRVELCDQRGEVLGLFIRTLDLSHYEGLEPQISKEKLLRREQETETYSTTEVLQRLESL